MAAYEYKCRVCPFKETVHAPIQEGPPLTPPYHCHMPMRRVYSVNTFAPMEEHVSPATGLPVRSIKQAQQQLDRMSDEVSQRLGLEHRFKAVDPRDPILGRTDEGLDATYKRLHDSGQMSSKSMTRSL